MKQLSKESFKFMADLWANNSKAWFDENRKRYEEHVRLPMKAMVEALTEPVATILPEFTGKPKISRINNDIRFSLNKPPYKEHIWISFIVVLSEGQFADLFVGINRNGWFVGSGIGSQKREPLNNWRRNLIGHAGTWRRYMNQSGYAQRVEFYCENKYKKPLFDDIPADLVEIVQSRSVWIVEKSKPEFHNNPVAEFFNGLCRMLPVNLFMITPTDYLVERLHEIGATIMPPDDYTALLWSLLEVT